MENFEIEKTEELFQAIKTKALKIIEIAQKEHDLDELSILDNQLYMILKQSFDSNSAQKKEPNYKTPSGINVYT